MISIKKRTTNAPMGKWRMMGWNLPIKNTKVLSTLPSRGIRSSPNNTKVKVIAISKMRFMMN
jgi:hypothetical protein